MFHPGHWAAAFINSLERENAGAEEGIEVLKILASWIKSLPGEVFGTSAAKKAGKLMRDGLSTAGGITPVREITLRFLSLIIRKNKCRYIDSVISEAEKLLDKRRGVVTAFIESAAPMEEEFESSLKKAIQEFTQAARVDLTGKTVPELIGGYRLRIGDNIIDASICSQLKKLEIHLNTLPVNILQGGHAGGGF